MPSRKVSINDSNLFTSVLVEPPPSPPSPDQTKGHLNWIIDYSFIRRGNIEKNIEAGFSISSRPISGMGKWMKISNELFTLFNFDVLIKRSWLSSWTFVVISLSHSLKHSSNQSFFPLKASETIEISIPISELLNLWRGKVWRTRQSSSEFMDVYEFLNTFLPFSQIFFLLLSKY
jgi:hypothetical protein